MFNSSSHKTNCKQNFDNTKLPYRPCVGMMIVNKEKMVFVAKRSDIKSESWQMPQGGINKGEDPEVAVIRELEEEVGTNKVNILQESKDWLYYDLPKRLAAKLWNGRYRGQKQKWFLMEFCGDDKDINIETEHPEFCEWKWVEPGQIVDIIVPFKKRLYTEVLQEFSEFLK